ncbi:MBL fold metallo-hydrolase [Bacillus mangrovi]|uniref:MBL fold metallo-hydrolase n=1 Tax=Metabacillus mangrovi TaxID=1491830 RepID=A0A7X2V6A6_9BACI|nr:MBL fold metallo-hydrolase [Metabacillus mangrovi]MTH55677.1 MBL fold metallo-hydrolase [Metabacillus mangrovi]
MEIQLIRNATLKINYGGKTILVDPFLAEKGAMPAFPNTPNQHLSNPMTSLPLEAEEIVKADAVLVSHLHPDHFDEEAKNALPKETRIYAQSEEDAEAIRNDGFLHAEAAGSELKLDHITIKKTGGSHGRGDITKMTGPVSGFILTHPEEKTLYIAGDSVWCPEVQEAIQTHNPEVIAVNAGAAQFLEGGVITMDKEDIENTALAAPQARIIAIHMETLNHCLLSRTELNSFLQEKGLSDRVHVPEDGETMSFQ